MKLFCHLTAVAVRREPSERSEMVNQLLEGDSVEVIGEDKGWCHIRSDYDGYEGWVVAKQLETYAMTPSSYALGYVGTPYLWGGRSRMGIDCSGLTQVCFKACGVTLLRDACQQATQGVAVAGLGEAKRDDLCFFVASTVGDNVDACTRPTHVGIYLGDGHIVHASGRVRIDRLDERGVFDTAAGQYTHWLLFLRRIMSL